MERVLQKIWNWIATWLGGQAMQWMQAMWYTLGWAQLSFRPENDLVGEATPTTQALTTSSHKAPERWRERSLSMPSLRLCATAQVAATTFPGIAPHVDHVYTRVLPVADLWGKIELDVRVLIRSDRCVPSLVAKFENYSILQPSGKAPRNRLLLRQVSAKQGGPVLGPQHHKTSNLSKPEGKCW